MESIVAGSAPYETWYPATAVPTVGTDICGFPREAVMLSFTCSHVQIDGCRLKSVNHSHAVSSSGHTRARVRILALTPHLHRSMLFQQSLCVFDFLGRTLNPHPVVALTQ